jgi:peroxiredoxin
MSAPDFVLERIDGGQLSLAEARTGGERVVLVFASEECPTSALTLQRLAPVVPRLDGTRVVVIVEDPPEAAARMARRAGIETTVLSERPPYDTSRAYEVQTVPTTVLVGPDGEREETVVGWDRDALNRLLGDAHLAADPPERKPGCAAKSTYDAELLAADAAAVDPVEEMFERGWTDGLPVVPPTPERVAAMLGDRDPQRSLGPVAPAHGEATLERVAACAVLAGCAPEHFPVVVAAAEAALDPAFNLHGQAVTTQPTGQLIVVNGPVRHGIGLNSGMGALGPGWRANATIGRAVRLLLCLTGGGMPGRMDRSTLGNPGKYTVCIAENEETSPWEPFHVERGLPAEASAVTLVAGDAPLTISEHRSRTPEELAHSLAWAAQSLWSPFWWPLGAPTLYVICPEHARMFAEASWSRQRLRETMFETVVRPAGELNRGETTPQVKAADPDAPIHKWDSPEDILLVVAGGEAGRFSAVYGPCLGMQNEIVTREVAWST